MSLSLLILSLLAQPSYAKPQDVGNGGDLILCQADPSNPFVGTMALDYVLTYQDAPLAPVKSLDRSLTRIESLIAEKVPGLLESFKAFRAALFNETDPTLPFMWTPVVTGLVNVHDEDIKSAERVPENCRKGLEIPLMQAVIRQAPPVGGGKTVNHKYMKEVILQLAQTNPLQVSFLLVHEWLWNLSDNVTRNRQIDRFFHSTQPESMTPIQVQEYLISLGLNIPAYVPYLFDTRLCLGSGNVERGIENKVKDYLRAHNLPETAPAPFGPFHVRAEKRNCTSSRCDGWREAPYFAQHLDVAHQNLHSTFLLGDRDPLTLVGMSYFGEFPLADCDLKIDGAVTCSNFLDPSNGRPFEPEGILNSKIYFGGWTNGSCAHLTAEGRSSESQGVWLEWRYGIYFWIDPK